MADPSSRDNNIFSVVSLFSGGGLLDLGFMNAGFQIKQAFEINEQFIEGYNYAITNYLTESNNHFITSKLINHNTITEAIDVSDKLSQRIIEKQFKGITGLIGGPPCQDYSVGGKNKGISGDRGRLILSYLRLVQLTRPQFIFFENVEGLYKTKRHRERFLYLIERLEVLGYMLWYDLINPLSYGFPQDRSRIIVVGFRKEIVQKIEKNGYIISNDNEMLRTTDKENFVFKWPKVRFINPKLNIVWPTQWKFNGPGNDMELSSIPEEYASLQVNSAFLGITDYTPNQMDQFTPKSDKFWKIPEGDTVRKSFKRLHRYRYSPTVAYGNNEVHLHPTEARRLSVREALRLQTVPDEYVFPSSLTLSAKFKMISNGVPTKQAELIAVEIRKTLLRYLLISET